MPMTIPFHGNVVVLRIREENAVFHEYSYIYIIVIFTFCVCLMVSWFRHHLLLQVICSSVCIIKPIRLSLPVYSHFLRALRGIPIISQVTKLINWCSSWNRSSPWLIAGSLNKCINISKETKIYCSLKLDQNVNIAKRSNSQRIYRARWYPEPGPRLNIKTVLSTYGDFHIKDKTAVSTSYL